MAVWLDNEIYPPDPDIPNCDGDGVVTLPCRMEHPFPCGFGNPGCDDEEIECPGCPNCKEDTCTS